MKILSLCEKTGHMLQPWADAGHDCLAIDIQHSIRRDRVHNGILYMWGDVRSITPPWVENTMGGKPDVIFGFPPCTNLALSGARDFKKKGRKMYLDSLILVDAVASICEWFNCTWMIEQPMSRLTTAWRKPDQKFTPWEYGEDYQKETWLWTNKFTMPEKSITKKPSHVTEKIWLEPPGKERANIRSATSELFAKAVYEANHE
jgi:hypothetical protein